MLRFRTRERDRHRSGLQSGSFSARFHSFCNGIYPHSFTILTSVSFIWTPLHQSHFWDYRSRKTISEISIPAEINYFRHTRAHPLRQCHGLFCPITPQQVCNLLSGQHDSPSINRIHSGLPSINMRQSISRGATGDERVCVCLERKGSRLGGKVVLTDHNSRLVPPTHSFVLLKCAVPAYKANQLRNIHR